MTGALEVGAEFNAVGLRAVVTLKPVESIAAEVIVYDTETRHLSPASAAEVVRRFVQDSNAIRPEFIYKKTDSTLRGNISSELKALSQLFPDWRIGYAPAYPALGRTVKDGILYVDGVAVSQTSFGSDPLNPVTTSRISSLLDDAPDCTIFDGEYDWHIEDAARIILADESMRIIAGPGALAGVIAGQLVLARPTAIAFPRISSCLVMNGSRHERSVAQVQKAEAPGWTILQPSRTLDVEPVRVASANAKILLEEIAARDPDGVFVIGGDTAFAVVAALGSPALWPVREVVPGVPITRIRAVDIKRTRDLFLITKAGGFGGPDVISRVHKELNIYAE
jgi:uncharacterized protein YgbK (DUF1537 family)